MKSHVSLAACVALGVCGAAAAQQDTRVLEFGRQILELRSPAQTPSLGEVLEAHDVALNQADSVGPFLIGVLQASSFDAEEIQVLQVSWIGAEPPGDPMRDPWFVDVIAVIDSDLTALVNMHVSDGDLHMTVTRPDQLGLPSSIKVACTISEPIAVLQTRNNAPALRAWYLAVKAYKECVCDKDNVNTYGCTSTDCDTMETCPSLPPGSSGGFACGWIAVAVPVEIPVEMTGD